MSNDGSVEVLETKRCNNCKKEIDVRNFMVHDAHCHRNIILCPKCDTPVPKQSLAEHEDEIHASVNCTKCDLAMERRFLEDHSPICPKRPTPCPYCELEVSWDGLKAHEDYCGTRTDTCANCHRQVMLKDALRHQATGCAYPAPPVPTFVRPVVPIPHRFPRERDRERIFVPHDLKRLRETKTTLEATPTTTTNDSSSNVVLGEDSDVDYQYARRLQREEEQLTEDSLYALSLSPEMGEVPASTIPIPSRKMREAMREPPPPALNEVDPTETGMGDDSLLPCEFCAETFPAESLIFHQVGCDRNTLVTPRLDIQRRTIEPTRYNFQIRKELPALQRREEPGRPHPLPSPPKQRITGEESRRLRGGLPGIWPSGNPETGSPPRHRPQNPLRSSGLSSRLYRNTYDEPRSSAVPGGFMPATRSTHSRSQHTTSSSTTFRARGRNQNSTGYSRAPGESRFSPKPQD